MLALSNFEKTMHLRTDACDYGYGSVLEQKQEDGSFKPIAYFSKNYTPAERNYATSEKELLSVVKSIEEHHQYLYRKPFFVHTDHLPLTWILSKRNVHPRLERWLPRISIYDFVIDYIPGQENIIADSLFDRKEIKKAIKECEICQKVKNTTRTHKGELHFLTPGRPNELITVDIAGPFRKTKNLNK